jgi:cytochrome P450
MMTVAVPVAPGRWPLAGHTPALLRQRFDFTSSLHHYGEVVRLFLGPLPVYLLTTPELAHRVLVTDAANYEKGIMFDKFRPYFGNGLVMSNGAFHLRQRRLMQPAFHRTRIAGYADMMVRVAADLAESWQPGEIRAIDDDMQHVAITVVGRTLFSTELDDAATEETKRSIPIVIKQGMIRVLSPAMLEKLPLPGIRGFDQAIARLRELVLGIIARRRADGQDRGDLLSTLLLVQDEETGETMNDQQVYDEVVTLMTAGIETTAIALAWLFHEVARHPDVEKRLVAELDEVLGGRAAGFDDLPKLTYTRQVVDEVLRMYPVWLLMRRAVADVELGGVTLPAGTEVAFSPHAFHHDPRYFPDPERFDPDRWSPGRAESVPRGAYVPFAAGARHCLGYSFALTELVVVAATVLSRWQLVPVPGKPVRTKVTGAPYPSRLPMTVIPRHAGTAG